MNIARRGLGFLVATIAMTMLFPAEWVVAGGPQEVKAILTAKSLPAQIDVVGVVSRRDAAKSTFALIDRADCFKCPSTSCAPPSLPVQWTGTLPGVRESVRVKGSVRDTKDGKFLFADSVESVGK